jgi:DNA-binding CsgD family transcriptional regulator/tetratricopeptide (TPR) repeat protein
VAVEPGQLGEPVLSGDPAQADLIGRDGELTAISGMLGADGGSALLLVGGPGTGKSALLAAASRAAAGHGRVVLRAAGVRSEARVPFAGLHQLLYPLTNSFGLLAPRLRETLLVAFGHLGGPPVAGFLVAIAALELLAETASGRGLLVIVDDLHWIDDASAQVLGFVTRRIASEPIALVAAAHPGLDQPLAGASLPVRTLWPLSPAEAERLLLRHHPELAGHRCRWTLRHAQGNPLALVDLPVTAGTVRPGDAAPVPLTARLERSFAAPLCELSPSARSALVVAAACDGGDCAELAAATELAFPGVGAGALHPAVDAGILVMSQASVAFAHPLTRAAVYQSASADTRRLAHAALAGVLGAQPDRRAWHLAAAAPMPDEAVAAELERAAESAAGRGDSQAGAAAWEQAAAMTPAPDRRARRLLCAAEVALELGQPEQAGDLAATAEALPHGPPDAARLALIRETLSPGIPGDPLRVLALTELAAELTAAGDTGLACRLVTAAAVRAWSADPGPRARDGLASAVSLLALPAGDPRLLSIGGYLDPVRYGALISRHVAGLRPGRLDPASADLALSAHLVGAGEAVTAVQRAAVDDARRDGRLAALPRLLTQLAWTAIARADWPEAGPAAGEAARLAAETRQPVWEAAATAAQAMTAALRGGDDAERLAKEAESLIAPARISPVQASIQFARGVAAIAAGRYDEAYDQLRRLFDRADPAYQPVQSGWALGDLAEAAARTGQAADAREILAGFRPGAGDSGSPWTRVALLYAAPLLADEDTAEQEFRRALGADLSRWPAYRARLLLEYGSWQRRRYQVALARRPLRAARELCEAHGLLPWAERARRELRATGEAVSEPGGEATAPPPACLSPQELRIARLAAEGLSNREIGQRLYLSHRTVGSHLYRMFPKLGITSRIQLPSVLATADTLLPASHRPAQAAPFYC